MEDFYETRIDGVEGEIVGLFGVFDGISLSLSPDPHTHTHMHGKVDFSINILHRTYILHRTCIFVYQKKKKKNRTYIFVSFCECEWTCVAC